MQADHAGLRLICEQITRHACNVFRQLGRGLPRELYEAALGQELRDAGFPLVQPCTATARYGGVVVGEYSLGLLVDHKVVVQANVDVELNDVHRIQCERAIEVAGVRAGVSINFGPTSVTWRMALPVPEALPPVA
jgi:GxxExxY protein